MDEEHRITAPALVDDPVWWWLCVQLWEAEWELEPGPAERH